MFNDDEYEYFESLSPREQILFVASKLKGNESWVSDLLTPKDFNHVYLPEGKVKARMYMTDSYVIVGYSSVKHCKKAIQRLMQDGYVLLRDKSTDVKKVLSSTLWRQSKYHRCYRIVQYDSPIGVN